MTRRGFMRTIGFGAVALAAWACGASACLMRKRCVRAIAAREFPGRLRPLGDAAVARAGRWRG